MFKSLSIKLLKKSNPYFILKTILSILIWVIIITEGILKGGRWTLGDQIITGFNIINGNFNIYQPGIEGSFSPTTIYPYLQSILFGILSKIVSLKQVELISILIISPLLGVFIFNLLVDLTLRANQNKKNNLPKSIHITIIAALFFTSQIYISYLSELKPDSLALVFILLTFYLTADYKNKDKLPSPIIDYKKVLTVSFLLFLSCSTKQQFLLPSLVICLYIFFISRSFLNLVTLLSGLFLSFIVPSLILHGYFKMIVLSMANRGFAIFETSLGILETLIMYLSALLILVFLCTISLNYLNSEKILSREVSLSSKPFSIISSSLSLNKIYLKRFSFNLYIQMFLVFGAIFLSQIISSYNVGGNAGNFQMGAIPFFSLIIPSLININFSSNNKLSILKDFSIKNATLISIFTLTFSLGLMYKLLLPTNIQNNFYLRDKAFINHISNLYKKDDLVLVDGYTTLSADLAGYKNQASIDHFDHLSRGALSYMSDDFAIFLKSNKEDIPYFHKGSLKKRIESNEDRFSWAKEIVFIDESCSFEEKRKSPLFVKPFCNGIIKISE